MVSVRKIALVAVALVAVALAAYALYTYTGAPKAPREAEKPLKGMKVLFIVSFRNFRDEELKAPLELLKELGAEAYIASTQKGVARGMLGMLVDVNLTLSEVDVSKFDAIVFIGGRGTPKYLWRNPEAVRIAKEAYEEGKVVAAICLAPGVLAEAGILKGKRATAYHTAKQMLIEYGAEYVSEKVVVEGKIVTAMGPEAAEEFAEAIAKLLSGG
ncbi:MAG: hypothetical protein DRN99_08965 [Thermoproteota archaeon]|nr:MAG: hypothetical protein DRN99_08965 [Candidatus Korarchaeota archaeon]